MSQVTFKGQCHEISTSIFSLIEPILAPDKQAKMVFLKNSFLQRSLNLKFKNSTLRRLTLCGVEIFRQASTLKS